MDWEKESSNMEVEVYTNSDAFKYTVDQKHQNYQRILKTIKYLENNGRITEDWYIKHKELIFTYRAWISDFSILNMDITDPEFRKMAVETERMITTLIGIINVYRFIDPILYLQFAKNIKKMYETVMTEDELNDCMSKMCM